MKTTLLILTFDEIDGMKEIMPKIKKEWVDQIIILDAGSTDGTLEYAKENGYFTVVQKNEGLRKGYVEALPYVEGDVIITFSPDGNSIPELIPEVVDKMEAGYDMVIVSRYLKGAKSEDDDIITSFGNWMFNFLINLFFKVKYTDVMVMFRAYRKQIIYDLNLDKDFSFSPEEKIFKTNVSWEPLMSIRVAKRKLKYTEIPGNEPPRIGGKRKLQIFRWGGAYLFEVFKEKFF